MLLFVKAKGKVSETRTGSVQMEHQSNSQSFLDRGERSGPIN